jgi:NADH-quinone oxidoreductase subunit H
MEQTIIVVVRSAALILFLLTGMAYMTLLERRILARMQVRRGPNRVGFSGLLQPLADGLKLLFKEDITPAMADPWLHKLAPSIILFSALAAFAVIPLGPVVSWGETDIAMVVVDMPVSLLYIVGASSLGVYGLVLGGWASGSKYSLLGGLRAAAQLVSYELILGIAIAGVVLVTGSLSIGDIVAYQSEHLPLVLVQPLGFVLFLIASTAEVNRAPFDLPEAETELVAGYHTEFSGLRFAMYFMAEYVNMFTASALAATLFFGGWSGPFLPGPWWLLLKMLGFLFVFVWMRATLPRLRYDQLMRLCWGVLLPLGLLNLAVTAVVVVLFDS